MGRGCVPLLAVIAVLAPGCGARESTPPASCVAGAQSVATALHAAPQPVALADGTRLSTCFKRARREADLQRVGVIFTQAADALAVEARHSDTAAVRLGYLIAAARRGARTTNGVAIELVRRIEQSTGLDGPQASHRAAFQRGLAAGERLG